MPGCGAPCVRLAGEQDQALAESIYYADQKKSKVVLSTTEVANDGSTNVLGGHARQLGARAANGSYIPDVDGVIRRFRYAIDGLETFPFVAAERALGHPLDPSTLPDKRLWIDFIGPPGAIPFLSFSRVLRGKFDPAVVRGAIVVVGVTAPTVQDVHATSTSGGSQMSGAGDPGERDPHGASRLPAPERAVVAEPARDLHPRVDAAVPRAPFLGGVDDRESRRYSAPSTRSERSTRSTRGTILAVRLSRRRARHLDRRRARSALRARRIRPAAHARHLRALRPGGGRQPGARADARRAAPRRRSRRRHVHVRRPARLDAVCGVAAAGDGRARHQPVPERADRGDPRARRNAHLLPRRRIHGRLRRADRRRKITPTARSARRARSSRSGCLGSTSGCASRAMATAS